MTHRHQYSWNRQHLIRDGKPWLPVMGEFHYARYPQEQWRQEIDKMKACGVDIVATYVFWIHHEAEEGVFDFDGQRSLHAFLAVCQEAGVTVWLRIGPWCHGECRNGGFPDWLMHKPFPIRGNGEAYMACVRRFWERVYLEISDSLYGNGGPVIGIQIENEFAHCGGSGEDDHIDNLLALANQIGFETPYYTATGWGGAKIGSLLPVMACYCDAPWDRRLEPLPPSPNYVFSHERNDVDVGSDFERGANVTFDEDAYPYLLAEMGGGIGTTFHRRPTATPADTGAMALVKLGSGANLLGYYMFHAGTNPGQELNETWESGSYCETPTLSYAPHSPIGEYGQLSDLACEVKLLHMFIHSFGQQLASMPAQLPACGAKHSGDRESPRYALRTKDGSGFLFVNNHQRCYPQPDMTFDVPEYGQVNAPSGYYAILPINLPIGNALLKRAKATPLCILNGNTYVFWCDGDPAYELEGDIDDCTIVTLSRQEALNAWHFIEGDREDLIICDAPLIPGEQGYHFLARKDTAWRSLSGGAGMISVPKEQPSVAYHRTHVNFLCYDYDLAFSYGGESAETYLQVVYEGSHAELFVDGIKVADDMYDGCTWEIGLARFGRPTKATLRIYALFEGMPVWLQNPPVYTDGRALKLHRLTMENEYKIRK
ncbi:MAG: beta-galactosidase [Clostridiales bacterium]|nr:beta-galactosidase [Clostridiales bacterium]